jgi:hypothetical protein
MLVYFLKGRLPWQGLEARDGAHIEQVIVEKKKAMTADKLCAGLPMEFAQYMQYVDSLRYEDEPDYSWLRERFLAVARREGIRYDNVFDWTEREYLRRQAKERSD